MNGSHHLAEEEIEKYSMATASEEETARVEEHLLICETCQRRLARADDYIRAMQTAARQLREEAQKPAIGRNFFYRLIPVFSAACLIVLVAIIGMRLAGRRTAVPPLAISLEATRGDGIEAKAVAGRSLMLNLDVSGVTSQSSYQVEVVDRLGNRVWNGTAAGHDSRATAMVLEREPGIYFIRLYASSGDLLREYGLEVRR